MRRSRRHKMYGRRNVYAGRYAKKTGVNLFTIVVIIGLAVALGFLTTKCVIYPLILGQEASFDTVLGKIGLNSGKDEKEDGISDSTSGAGIADADNASSAGNGGSNTNAAIPNTNDQNGGGADTQGEQQTQQTQPDVTATPAQSGYAIQFGSFSTESAANELITELKSSGIDAFVTQKDGMYKVIGQLFADKESAVNTKINIDSATGAKYSDAFVAFF